MTAAALQKEEKKYLKDFYVTTLTSVYHIRANDPEDPTAEKIALRGKSKAPLGAKFREGSMLAICDQIITYIPEGGGYLFSFERRIERVNTRYWRENSSPIVALFSRLEKQLIAWLQKISNLVMIAGLIPPKKFWKKSVKIIRPFTFVITKACLSYPLLKRVFYKQKAQP